MKKDIQTLVRVKHRYDKILNAESWDDLKMRDILLIPPTRAGKANEVVVQEVTHGYETRVKVAYEELLKQQIKDSSFVLQSKTLLKELDIQQKLVQLGPRVVIEFEIVDAELEFVLTKDCLSALSQRDTYLSDTIILASLQ